MLAIANSQEDLCSDQTDGSLLADPNHWNLYYSCFNEQATLMSCDENMVFSLEEQRCVRDSLDELQIMTTVEEFSSFTEVTSDLAVEMTVLTSQTLTTTTTDALETDSTTTITSTAVSTITTPTTIPTTTAMSNNLVVASFCPCRDTYEPTYLSSYDFCDRYFMCYHGRKLEMTCCRGHHWNSVLKRCVPEYESLCKVSELYQRNQRNYILKNLTIFWWQDDNSVVIIPDCPETGRAFYPHPYVCEYFYYCENGHQSLQQCDAFFYWDFYQHRCIIKTEAICITSLTKSKRRKYYI